MLFTGLLGYVIMCVMVASYSNSKTESVRPAFLWDRGTIELAEKVGEIIRKNEAEDERREPPRD